jgi:hypothetical protein
MTFWGNYFLKRQNLILNEQVNAKPKATISIKYMRRLKNTPENGMTFWGNYFLKRQNLILNEQVNAKPKATMNIKYLRRLKNSQFT